MAERSGYIRLERRALTHPIFYRKAFSEFEAWVYLLNEAAWKPRRRGVGRFVVDLERGQLVASVRFLADDWRWTPAKVARFLGKLQTETMIETHNGAGINIITICNYNHYQGDGDSPDEQDDTVADTAPTQPRDARDTPAIQRRDETEEIKHSRKEEGKEHIGQPKDDGLFSDELPANEPEPKRKPRQAAARKTNLDPNWVLPEAGWRYAHDRGWNDNHIRFQFDKFKNHHIGKGNKWADWLRAWYTWVGNDYDRGGSRTNGPGMAQQQTGPGSRATAMHGFLGDLTPEDFERHG